MVKTLNFSKYFVGSGANSMHAHVVWKSLDWSLTKVCTKDNHLVILYWCQNKRQNTFLLGREISESVELSVALDEVELDPEEELFDELEVDTDVLPLCLALGGIAAKIVFRRQY